MSIPSFTCPNIDGTAARGGCTYCENESFSPNLTKSAKATDGALLEFQLASLQEQYKRSSEQLRTLKGAEGFIIYFQSFTNTYADFETLKALYEKALSFKDVIGLSIGTRVDCVDDRILNYLKELSRTKEIWIEYGVQSIHDETLKKINRGHLSDKLHYWIPHTKEMGLNVCAHLIFGLYGETKEMMLASVDQCVKWGVDAYKFHPLYIVKGTVMANELAVGKIETLKEEDYIDVLIESIKRVPKDAIIQRITAGIDDDTLLAPPWCRDKNSGTCAIRERFKQNNIKLI